MRPCTPTRMTIWPLTTAQSRAARTKMPWYFSDIASLLPSGGGGGNVNVEAPWRISRKGHSTFGCALVTGCGSFCVAPEKKQPVTNAQPNVECPFLDIRQGASTLTFPPPPPAGGNEAMSLKYQGTFVRAARDCAVV